MGRRRFSLAQATLATQEVAFGSDNPWTKDSARVTADALDALGRTEETKALRKRYRVASILLDSMCRSRKRASASWMMRARSFGKSQWLFSALAEAGLPVICVETRHMRAVLKAQINKTDRNDARGIAQLLGRKVSWLLAAGACYFVRFWEQSELSANASACGALTADAMEWSR